MIVAEHVKCFKMIVAEHVKCFELFVVSMDCRATKVLTTSATTLDDDLKVLTTSATFFHPRNLCQRPLQSGIMNAKKPSRLKRLPDEYYQGESWIHWVLAIEDRKTGWLDARLLYRFREILTHAAFRYQFACPIFCLMPDHIHMLWAGLAPASNQLNAMKRFRTDMNESLRRIGFEFQRQAYDHVLKDKELERDAIEEVAEYIARNPERKGMVPIDGFASYPYTGCLLPGACQLRLFQATGWDEIWRTLAFLRRTECFRIPDPKYSNEDVDTP